MPYSHLIIKAVLWHKANSENNLTFMHCKKSKRSKTMSRIITLTSDLGTKDYFVSLLKGEIYSTGGKDLILCDISHEVNQYDIQQAALFVDVSYKKFPPGSIHVVKVFTYYTKDPEYICFEEDGHYFIGPNNGIFSLVFPELDQKKVFVINLENASNNKLIAHACACIKNSLFPDELGTPVSRLNKKLSLHAVTTHNNIRATVIHIDSFKNVILNITKEQFDSIRKGRPFELFYQQHDPVTRISNRYSAGQVGDVLCLFNSANLLEISINSGQASDVLNLKKGESIQIYFKDV